jgi:methionyl-tRNA formyltransferase
MRIVFMGSPSFALPSLAVLADSDQDELVAVVTQPDKPKGRGRGLAPPPVKAWALARRLPLMQPTSLRTPEVMDELRRLAPELIVVAAYGKILPQALLDIPSLGCINVHASLLPRYRGAAPIAWAILRGERETGITLMRMEAGMDSGPILLRRSEPIADDDTAGSLGERLAALGALVLADGLGRLRAGTLTETAQDAALATMAPRLEKELGEVDFTRPAAELHCFLRAMDPWPGAYTFFGGESLRLFGPRRLAGPARPIDAAADPAAAGPAVAQPFRPDVKQPAPGTIVDVDRDGLVVTCGQGTLLGVLEVQAAGGKRMSARAYAAGHALGRGSILGRKDQAR